jgi:flagellar basal body P-ring formation protein FlgA
MSQLDVIKGKKPDFKRLLLAVAMTALVINSAFAGGLATPRAEVHVAGGSVTVGDIFDGATQHADYVLAPAPAAGAALTLNAQDLQRVSDAFQLGWHAETGREQVVVRRSGHEIDQYAIEGAVQEALVQALNGQKFEIELPPGMAFPLPQELPATAEARNLRYDLGAGEFRAVIVAPAGSESPAVKQEISGRIHPLASIPVLKTPLRQGDVISAADIEYVEMRAAKVSPNIIVDAGKLIGMSPRRGVPAFRPIPANEIIMPVIVRKGDLVMMELNNGSIFLSTQGKALENGAAGETVRVQNASSNQVVQGVVTGPKAVTVSGPGNI